MIIKDFKREFYDVLSGHHVLIFVNYDVDAVCAVKILTYLFQCDNIQHTVVPISDLIDLIHSYKDRRNHAKYILMINIGASFDVVDLLEPEEEQVIFVIDNHRPFDVYNIYREKEIKLLVNTENETDATLLPSYEQLFRDSDDEDDIDEQNEKQFTLEELNKRKDKREWEEKRRKVLFEYSQFSYYGPSSSYLFFELSKSMAKDCKEVLWLAIVGVTEMYIMFKIEYDTYIDLINFLKDNLIRLNHNENIRNKEDSLNDIQAIQKISNIVYQKDLQLCLYRHWSIFESLRHTLLISCKFKVWNIKGYKRLLEFLAELGMPLIQCKQKYYSMDFEFRKNVLTWIENLVEKYDLEQILGDSFLLSKSLRCQYTAQDVVYSVKALLESPDQNLNKYDKFFEAQEALTWLTNLKLLEKGMELAKVQLVALLKQVRDTINMRMVTSSGPFLCCNLPETIPDIKFFVYPSFLIHFSKFLLTAFVASSRNRKVLNLPLVILTTDPLKQDICLAVGIPPIAEKSTKNLFGKAFIQIGQMLKCVIEPDLYDISIVRFPVNEKSKFLESLVSLLS